MKRVPAWIVCAFLSGLVLFGCRPTELPPVALPEGAQVGELIQLEACRFRPPDGKTEFVAECGTLAVPENWDRIDSRLIGLPVVRIRATGSDPAEPVFFLEGGPGQSNLAWEPSSWLLQNHDVVMVGYRGVDGTVVLSCDGLGRLINRHLGKDLLAEPARAEYIAETERCAARHQAAGVDLSGYTIPGVVGDMEAARRALGYERINLFSHSYGTRVAQLYAYLHPASLHRLVLIAVNTPGHFVDDPAVFDTMIDRLSALCAQDASCHSRTPELAQTLYDVNRNMPNRWLWFRIDADTVRMGVNFMFYNNPNMAQVLDAYLAAGEGDPSGLAMANLIMSRVPLGQILEWGDEFSKAVPMDLAAYREFEGIGLGTSIMGAPLSELVWPMGATWPVDSVPESIREFQESDVEMLLVNGTMDFATPPTALDQAKPYFHRAQMVLLPEFSHVYDIYELQPEAYQRLITSYYATGVGDDSLFRYQPVSFEPKISLTVMAKLLAAAFVALPTLILVSAVLILRWLRRRRSLARNQSPGTQDDRRYAAPAPSSL